MLAHAHVSTRPDQPDKQVRLPGAFPCGLILVAFLMTSLFLPVTASSDPDVSAPANMLSNGDFMRGVGRWLLQADAPASARIQVIDTPATLSDVRSKVLHIDIPTLGEHNWNVQLYQSGLDIADDKPYTITFWAHADRERTVDLNMALDKPDWHTVGLAVTHAPLTRDWRKFVYTFTTSHVTKGHSRLAFVLGDAPGVVELAQVSLLNEAPGLPSGPNLLESADFADNTGDWSLQHSGTADAKLDWLDAPAGPPDVSGKVARMEVVAAGQNNWNVQFQQSGLDLKDREPYTLTFWARADQQRALNASMGLDIPDWHAVGLNYQANVTPMWRKFSVVFTATHTVKDHIRLSFLLGDAPGSVELAGLQLQQNVPPDPQQAAKFTDSAPARSLVGVWANRSEDVSRRFRLTFNPDGTGSVRTGARSDAAPTAPVNGFHWYLKERPQRLVIGLRAFTWSIRTANKELILALTDRKGQVHLFYRQ